MTTRTGDWSRLLLSLRHYDGITMNCNSSATPKVTTMTKLSLTYAKKWRRCRAITRTKKR